LRKGYFKTKMGGNDMKKSKRSIRIGFVLVMLLLVAGIVYAVAMALEEIPNRCGETRLDTRRNDLGAIQVAGQKDVADPKPDPNLEGKLTELGSFYQRANEERKRDKAVSGKTRTDAASLSKEIKAICDANAEGALKEELPKASELYSYAGENTVYETQVYTKDQISAKDMDEIRERLKKEQKLLDEAYKEIDPSSLTPAQKNYLTTVSLKNLQENLAKSQSLIRDVEAAMKGGGLKSMLGGGLANLGKSLLEFLKTLIENIRTSISHLMRLAQS
jgi:hypothetical protein